MSNQHALVPLAGISTTAINIICNILGGALLVLPTAFMDMSVIPAIVVTLLMGLASVASIAMLTVPSARYSKFTYKDLLTIAFSDRAGRAFDVVVLAGTFGLLIDYAKIVAQAVPLAAEDVAGLHNGAGGQLYTQQWFWLLLAFPVFWALSSMKQLTNLKFTNMLGIVTIYYVVFFILTRFLMGTEVGNTTQSSAAFSSSSSGIIHSDVRWLTLDLSAIKGFPILAVSYSCHYNIPTFYGEMLNRSPARFGKAIGIAMPVVMITYTLAGLCGYVMFGSARVAAAKGNIMAAFPASDVASTIGQLGLFLHFTSVFPIVALACRRCANQLLFGSPWQSQKLYIGQAFILVSSACTFAYLVPGVGIVVEIIGELCGMSIVYVVPAAIYIKLGGSRGPTLKEVQDADQVEEAEKAMAAAAAAAIGAKKEEKKMALEGDALLTTNGEASVVFVNEAAKGPLEAAEDTTSSEEIVSSFVDAALYRLAWCFVVCGIIISLGSFTFTIYRLVVPAVPPVPATDCDCPGNNSSFQVNATR